MKPAKLQLKPQNEAIARKRLCSSEEIEAKKIRAIETKHKKQFEKEALEMDARNKATYAIIMSEEKKTLEEEVEELVRREEAEEARQKAAEKAEEAARQASINESKKLIQILETNVMTKELQKMKIDKRNDSCSKCDYVFKQENIANIENVDLYKDFDFSEEIDEDSVCKELDGV